MILKKLTAALIAAATTITPLSFNASAPISYAEDTVAIADLPDWIPSDFSSAVEFRNHYGATHIDNGLICIVYPDRTGEDTWGYELSAVKGMGDKLKQEMYTNGYSETCFDVFVYQPIKQGDVTLNLVDPCAISVTAAPEGSPDELEPSVAASYSFSVDQELNITETDIFSWLPDCNNEYQKYVNSNTILSVKDNYVVFCLSNEADASYEWSLYDSGKECFELVTVSDCRHIPLFYPDEGTPSTVYAYKAVKDGYAKIEYDCGAADDDRKHKLILDADCAVMDDAQTVLLSGDMRVTLVDYDTGEQIIFKSGDNPSIWTDTIYNNNQTSIMSDTYTSEISVPSGPFFTLETNPAILGKNISSSFDADSFSFGLEEKYLPEGYSFIDDERQPGYYNGTIVPENSMTVTRYDNGSADVVFRLKNNNDIEKKSTKITFYDEDTGELIDIPEGNTYIMKSTSKAPYTSEIFDITSNPCTIASDHLYENSCYYSFNSYTRSGYYSYLKFEITSDNQDCIELTCRMKWRPSGDFNGDNNFSISDVIFLQKWLLGAPCTETADFKAADFCRDDRLDIFDLILMRRELIDSGSLYVEPDVKVGYSPITVLKNGLKLYIGPDESYGYIEYISIPEGTKLNEDGYQNGNDNWVFVCYNFRYGWIKTVKDDNMTPTIRHEVIVAKPVIYLYPEEETDVHVELELTEAELSTTYPKYNNGWDVTASPDGSLLNKADGSHHKYLFWDAVNCRTRFDFSKGFCVAGSDTEKFLKEKLTYMGLTEEEMNEFIVYWLPLMEHNKYNLISFQGDVYTDSAKLNISPAPDSMLRVFMAYVPLEEAIDIEPQQLSTFKRTGFTVVEWGGSKIQ